MRGSHWGHSVVVTTRSVDRCVTTLRGKIEPNARRPTIIQTVRDIGYRFEPLALLWLRPKAAVGSIPSTICYPRTVDRPRWQD